mmetsp:Transcript_68832/g.159575  ORF Transcript_68832/g.159575 Transcript_68832/m.159575 type:complete len:260 (-) Transcript_68832:268-1047(-)
MLSMAPRNVAVPIGASCTACNPSSSFGLCLVREARMSSAVVQRLCAEMFPLNSVKFCMTNSPMLRRPPSGSTCSFKVGVARLMRFLIRATSRKTVSFHASRQPLKTKCMCSTDSSALAVWQASTPSWTTAAISWDSVVVLLRANARASATADMKSSDSTASKNAKAALNNCVWAVAPSHSGSFGGLFRPISPSIMRNVTIGDFAASHRASSMRETVATSTAPSPARAKLAKSETAVLICPVESRRTAMALANPSMIPRP